MDLHVTVFWDVMSRISEPTFQRNILPTFSGSSSKPSKQAGSRVTFTVLTTYIEKVQSSEKSVDYCKLDDVTSWKTVTVLCLIILWIEDFVN
jgi:hypothetical protein